MGQIPGTNLKNTDRNGKLKQMLHVRLIVRGFLFRKVWSRKCYKALSESNQCLGELGVPDVTRQTAAYISFDWLVMATERSISVRLFE